MVTNKMMADVDVFSTGRDGVRFCNDTGTLVIAEDGKGLRGRKFGKSQEQFDPKRFLNGVGQSIVL